MGHLHALNDGDASIKGLLVLHQSAEDVRREGEGEVCTEDVENARGRGVCVCVSPWRLFSGTIQWGSF